MLEHSRRWQLRLLGTLSLPLLALACEGTPLGPSTAPLRGDETVALAREVHLGSCENLAVRKPEHISARYYGIGTQNYMWDGSEWYFIGPTADLYASPKGDGKVGIHYSGPTWVSTSGSGVVGRQVDQCTPDPQSIPWLLMTAVSSRGPGIFDGTTHIQRLNTVGGLTPTVPGTSYGDIVRVPYSAEYVFYR